MRQIKFRGKRIDDGEWIFGCLADVQEQYGYATINYVFDDGEEYWESCDHVDVNTVGQFTGLHDKDGKEIYEGDIIRSFDSQGQPIIHSIVYLESCAKFAALLDSNSKYGITYCDLDKDWIDEFDKVVIGNIHEKKNI